MNKRNLYTHIKRTVLTCLVWSAAIALVAEIRMPVRTLHYTMRDGMASNVVNTIVQDKQGYLWLGTNLGLTRFDGYSFVNFYRKKNGKRIMENITDIVEDTLHNRLLVRGTDYYIFPFDLESMQLLDADSTLAPLFYEMSPVYANESSTVHLAWDRGVHCKNPTRRHNAIFYETLADGKEVWATIDNGFYIYNPQTKKTEHYTSLDPNPVIESNLMSDVLLDRSGGVWMTNSVAGLYQIIFTNGNVKHHQLSQNYQSESSHSVRSFSQRPDGKLLVSNMDGDIYLYDLQNSSSELIAHKNNRIYATLTDKQGRLWIGTRNGGVYIGDRHLNTTDKLNANLIFHFFSTDNETVWISTLDKGLIAANEQADGSFTFNYYLENEKVHQVTADNEGRLWIATESGVFTGSKGEFRCVYAGCKFVSICCAADGSVWAASIGNGLLKIKNDEQTFITTANGLTNDCVKAVVWNNRIGVIAATDAGITIISPNGKTRNIFSASGMMADTYNESAALCLRDGTIVLGSLNGFVELQNNIGDDFPAQVFNPTITSFTINDAPRYQQQFEELTLNHDQNNIGITYSCLDYINLSSVIYSYRLDGIDSDWRPSTKESSALYNNLSPGHYRFRLRAACAGQDWGEETVCDIYICQPLWWTWQARVIYIIILALLIWHEWRHYDERQRLRRQLDQRITALYAQNAVYTTPPKMSPAEETESAAETEQPTEEKQKSKTNNATKAADKAFLDKLDDIILSSLLQKDLDMTFLAEKMCMSHRTLYRHIKTITGMTATEYVRKHRLAKAMQLLRDGYNPTEVSMLCGFNTPSYFTRCFKAEYGIPPSEV